MVEAGGRGRDKALRLSEAFRARVIDASIKSFVFELAGAVGKIDQFIELMRPRRGLARRGCCHVARQGPDLASSNWMVLGQF